MKKALFLVLVCAVIFLSGCTMIRVDGIKLPLAVNPLLGVHNNMIVVTNNTDLSVFLSVHYIGYRGKPLQLVLDSYETKDIRIQNHYRNERVSLVAKVIDLKTGEVFGVGEKNFTLSHSSDPRHHTWVIRTSGNQRRIY